MVAASTGMTAEQLVGCEIPGKRVELVRGQLAPISRLKCAHPATEREQCWPR